MRSQSSLFDLTSGTIALVGSGASAVSTLRRLRSAGANVRWYAGSLDVAEHLLLASAPPGRLEFSFQDPRLADFSEFTAVVAGSGETLDRAVSERAQAADVPVHVIGRPELSNFDMPAAGHPRRAVASQELAA